MRHPRFAPTMWPSAGVPGAWTGRRERAMDLHACQMLSARCRHRADDRPLPHHPAGNRRRRACRSSGCTSAPSVPGRYARTAYRIREGARPSARAVVHRAHRHAAGRLGAADADPHRRDAGAAARAADGRAAVPRARHRLSADRARARGGEGARGTGWWCWSATSPITAGRLQAHPEGQVTMPGPVDPARLLVCELADGAFEGVSGPIRPDWDPRLDRHA